MTDPLEAATNRAIKQAMATSRNNALDCAIEICDEFAKTGHGAECCAKALRDMREMLNPKIDA